jgi:small nuclear ribonucleoprotein D3
MSSASVPIKLLHEGEGNTVTVELKTGEVYRGFLLAAEDTMNCQLSKVTLTARDGKVSTLEHVYLRGSQIRFFVLPEVLVNGPMFKKVQQMKASFDAAQAAKPGGAFVTLQPCLEVVWVVDNCGTAGASGCRSVGVPCCACAPARRHCIAIAADCVCWSSAVLRARCALLLPWSASRR